MKYLAGIDIGGTKCAVTIGWEKDGAITGKYTAPNAGRKAGNYVIRSGDQLRQSVGFQDRTGLSAAEPSGLGSY